MTTNELAICSLEQSKRLRAAGFNWPTISYWDTTVNIRLRYHDKPIDHNNDAQYAKEEWEMYYISAPTIQHALKWFRDVKAIIPIIHVGKKNNKNVYGVSYIIVKEDNHVSVAGWFDTYEEADSFVLTELLTLIKKENGQTN